MNSHTFIAGDYNIVSHGNGWAYEITCLNTGYILWVQDSAAEELHKATQGFDNTDCLSDYMEALGEPAE